ncbi:efflux RND transporter permease subunit [Algivirga pacifica]|uniref:Efflux RND transporter permease subunit n=1 Tax=Algivirga pacifica TaxID=1162670 RepID=A0ABP9DCU2_9BACT
MDNKSNKKPLKEFGLSSFAINNSTSIFILTAIVVIFGFISYSSMPKEQFPEIRIPMVYINTVYPGNSPEDIENLVTRPIEKELKSIKGIDEITSTSAQDYSVIILKFEDDVEVSKAVQDTKDAVDKAKKDLPKDLDQDPNVMEMDMTEIPVMTINLSGDFEIDRLNDYAEYLQDEIEELQEVSKVSISGALEREIQINADLFKMDAMMVSFQDIENAVNAENVTISGGEVLTNGYRRSLRVSGEFESAKEMANIIVKSEDGNTIYLKDIAEVKDAYVERKSFARLARPQDFPKAIANPVVSLKVVKRGGENLIIATDKINDLLEEARESRQLPSNLDITITESQARDMENQLSNLENNIITGVILVTLVLLFFMGLRNALFVGMAIPLSMLMSFVILSFMGITLNMIVLFALILALGMLVDNAIVIIENIYRLREEGFSNKAAAKQGAGEVAMAIISSTATTLAAFVPLAFWGGMMGEFMKYLPITLIIVLASSLFIGLVINPVVAQRFMVLDDRDPNRGKKSKLFFGFASVGLAVIAYIVTIVMNATSEGTEVASYTFPNIMMVLGLIVLANATFLKTAAYWFQDKLLVRIEKLYLVTLKYALVGSRPYIAVAGTIVLLFVSIAAYFGSKPLVEFFPNNEPRYVYMYVEAPLGTDVLQTNKLTVELEKRLYKELQPYSNIIESVVTNVGENTNDPQDMSGGGGATPHKSKITVAFVPFEDRDGVNTQEVLKLCAQIVKEVPGVTVTTDKERNGPPQGKPVNIEVSGDDYAQLIKVADDIQARIETSEVTGIDNLGMDINVSKPELMMHIDRNKARRYGLSTAQVAMALRTAIYGKEISKFKEKEDEYPIMLRLKDDYRYNISSLADQRITFRDNKGRMHQVPISSVATIEYTSTVGEVKRKDLDKVITVSSNVTEGYNANEVVANVKKVLKGYEVPQGVEYKFTGQQEEQQESMEFLTTAMLIAMSTIFLILVSQFNSFSKPFIILTSVVLSLVGVFMGLTITGDPFVIIMHMIGIISLAGVVVNNAIVLIDYTDLLVKRRKEELGLDEDDNLSNEETFHCIVKAGYTRLRPVLLTAITTILGLIPMAVGLNIDFVGLFSSFSPEIYFGGDNAIFWGPMAKAVIYGLTFATFLTLVVVPTMYMIVVRMKNHFSPNNKEGINEGEASMPTPTPVYQNGNGQSKAVATDTSF